MKVDNWEDLIALAKEQGLTPREAWERIEKTNLKFLNRKSTAEKELKKGTRVQRLMFPKNNEEDILLAKNVPSLDVSGDFYNFKNLEDKIFFTLGDVSGKGVDAGLIMARVTSLFEILVEEKKSLIEIVSLINDNLYNLRSGKFLTGIFAVYDKKSKNLEFINAGHSECIISDNKKISPKITFERNTWGDSLCGNPSNKTFGPHGIDLMERKDGRFQLAVVNHYPSESIEMFELVLSADDAQWELVWRGCIDVPDQYYFNDIALKDDGGFFASHMYSRDIIMEEWLITSLFKSNSGHIVEWTDGFFKKLDSSEGSGPNGISLDRSSNMLFISYNQGDQLVKFDLSINEKINTYFVQSPDNIFLTGNSAWFTSLDFQPNDAGNCIEREACSLPFSIYEIDKNSFKLKNEYSFSKTVFGLPTIAIPMSDKIYMGSFHSDRLGYFIKK